MRQTDVVDEPEAVDHQRLIPTTDSGAVRLRREGRTLLQQARASASTLTLVGASVLATGASVAGLSSWVPLVASMTAGVSGWGLLRTGFVVPLRMRRSIDAVAGVLARDEDGCVIRTNGVFVAPGYWVTMGYGLTDGRHDARPDSAPVLAGLPSGDATAELVGWSGPDKPAILRARTPVTPAKRLLSLPAVGADLKIVGWMDLAGTPVRTSYDYKVLAVSEGAIVAAGPHVPARLASAAVIEQGTGTVAGLLSNYLDKPMRGAGTHGLSTVKIFPLTSLALTDFDGSRQ